jgi:hypothetical protein
VASCIDSCPATTKFQKFWKAVLRHGSLNWPPLGFFWFLSIDFWCYWFSSQENVRGYVLHHKLIKIIASTNIYTINTGTILFSMFWRPNCRMMGQTFFFFFFFFFKKKSEVRPHLCNMQRKLHYTRHGQSGSFEKRDLCGWRWLCNFFPSVPRSYYGSFAYYTCNTWCPATSRRFFLSLFYVIFLLLAAVMCA